MVTREQIEGLMETVRNLYLSDDIPWVIGYSGGKDSTATLQLVWLALQELSESQLKKTVHIINTDTLVESPVVAKWAQQSLKKMEDAAQCQNLPFVPHRLTPEYNNTFWVNLIGRGYPFPRKKFRWCTDRLKIQPVNKFAQYKLGTNEDEEDYRFRCKSLATIYNFFKIKDDKVTITNYGELKEFLENDTEYSLEHFIISETRSRYVKVQVKDQIVDYRYDEKFFKRYVNSMFNFIYITEQLNTDLDNNWLPTKETKIQDGKEIKCEYSQMVISLSSKTISKALRELSLSENDYKDKLDLFFSRDFKSIYIDYSRQVLEAVIKKIKSE